MPADTEQRVLHLEREVSAFRLESQNDRAAIRAAIQDQAAAIDALKSSTDRAHADVQELVDLMKGLKVLGRVVKWVSGAIALVGLVFGFGKGKWW